jgi:UDP-N-acetylmuramoylalanine--D-glutamate ligase
MAQMNRFAGRDSVTGDAGNLDVASTKAVVVGLGISGIWTARWLAEHGASVTVSDMSPEGDLDAGLRRELHERGIALEAGGHKSRTFLDADMIVPSPGVPHDLPVIKEAAEQGIPVLGELELASRLTKTPVVAVTGTNGKSTVTHFIGLLLEHGGLTPFVGGNIGTPLMAYVTTGQTADYAVVEVSSFQLDTTQRFSPLVSVILNLSPDHLDRYPNYEAYVQSKLKIFKNQGPGQFVVLNDDDPHLSRVAPPPGVQALRYGLERKKGRHAFVEKGTIRAAVNPKEPVRVSLQSFPMPGIHNVQNLMAVVLAGLALGIEAPVIQHTADEFKGLPHRLEYVGELKGVAFYNDSKATNVDAAVRAVLSFDRPLVLIAGGRHKGAEYASLATAAKGRVKGAVFLGEARELMARSFEGVLPYCRADDLPSAVSEAFHMADRGDVVLLAPACASFDMFSDYAQRGQVFRDAVEELGRGG